MPVLNQHEKLELFLWLGVNQHLPLLNQQKNVNVGSVKPSAGAACSPVNQLNQLNQHLFTYIEALNRFDLRQLTSN